jgi:sulfoxide reductase catalytic subunit YedY
MNLRRFIMWDVDRTLVTPETAFWNRRTFLKAGGLSALGMLGSGSCAFDAAPETGELELADTVKPLPGSAFLPCVRRERYTVGRPSTDELTAASFNNFYEFTSSKASVWRRAQDLTVRPWEIRVDGLVANARTLDIDELIQTMPCEERLYRFRCVERWAMAVPWSGFSLKALMDLVEPLSSAKYMRFESFLRPDEASGQRPPTRFDWPYQEGLTIEEAANELCFCATGLYGHDLPKQHGAPLRMVVPWKYGYKGAKSVVRIEFVAQQPRTFWSDAWPEAYGFYANVDPNKPHPSWSQQEEVMLGTGETFDTLLYNGYGEFVAHMYTGDEH